MFSIAAVDLDDTLVRSDRSVSDRTLRALINWSALCGHVIIATGRPPRWTRMIPEELHDYPWICYNGAVAYEGGEKVYENLIDAQTVEEVVDLCLSHSVVERLALEIDDVHYSNLDVGRSDVQVVANLRDFARQPAAKILLTRATFQQLQPELAAFEGRIKALISDKVEMIQLMSPTASKGEALYVMLQRWGEDFTNVVAFGDDVNDVEMLRESGLGVAMANAVDALKSVANRITLSNDEDGVALVLEALMPFTGS